MIAGLDHGATKIAAGIGSWDNIAIAQPLASTGLDAMTIHFYPTSAQSMKTALQIAALAHQNGKAVILDEAWLYKSTESLPAGNINDYYNQLKRDVFSFWAPLDQQFLQTMARMCRVADVEFMSPFWSLYFFGYLNYTPALNAYPYTTLRTLSSSAATQGLEKGLTTSTGAFYQSLISQQ